MIHAVDEGPCAGGLDVKAQLANQGLLIDVLSLRTESVVQIDTHVPPVQVALEVQHMSLEQSLSLTAVEGGTMTDRNGGDVRRPIGVGSNLKDAHVDTIESDGVGTMNVRSRKSEFAAAPVSVLDRASDHRDAVVDSRIDLSPRPFLRRRSMLVVQDTIVAWSACHSSSRCGAILAAC